MKPAGWGLKFYMEGVKEGEKRGEEKK